MIPTLAAVYALSRRCLSLPHSWFHLAFLFSYSILCFSTFGSSAKCCQKFVKCDVYYACINGVSQGIFENTKGNHLVYDLRSKHMCVNSSMIFSDSAFPEGLPHGEMPIVKFSSFTAKTFSLKQEEAHYDRQCSVKPPIPTDDWPHPFTHDNQNLFNYRNSDVLPSYYAEKNLNTELKTNFPGFHTDIYFHVPYGCNHNMSYDSKSLSTDLNEFSLVIDDVADDFSVLLHRLFENLSVFHGFVSQPMCEIHHITGTLWDDVIFNKIPYFHRGGCRVVDCYNLCRFGERHLKQWLGVGCDSVEHLSVKEMGSHGKVDNGPHNSERTTRIELNYGNRAVLLDVEIFCEKLETFKQLFKPPGRKLLLGHRSNFMSFFIEPLAYSLVKDFELVKSWTLSHPSYVEGVMHGKTRLDDSISSRKWHSISYIQFSSKKLKETELLEVAVKSGITEEENPSSLARASSPTPLFQRDDLGEYANQFAYRNKIPVFSIQGFVLGPEELKPSCVSYPSLFCKEFPEMVVIIPSKFRHPVPVCSREGRPLAWVWSKRPFVAAFLIFSLLFLVFCSFSPQTTASPLNHKSLPCHKNPSHIRETLSEVDSPSSWSPESPPFGNRGLRTGFSIAVSPSNPVKESNPLSPLRSVGSSTRASKEKKRRRKRKGGGGGSIIAEASGSRSGNSTPSSPSSPVSYENCGRNEAAFPPTIPNSATPPPVEINTHDMLYSSPPPRPSGSPLPPYDRAPGPKSYSGGVKEEEMMYDIWGDHLSRIRLCNVMGGSVEGAEHSFFTCGPHVLVKSRCGSGE